MVGPAHHTQPKAIKAFDRLRKRAQKLPLDIDWRMVQNLADLELYLSDVIEHAGWGLTEQEMYKAKLICADVRIARLDEARRS